MRRSTRAVIAECGSVVNELAAGRLGDQRLDERRDRVLAVLEQQPDRGFPDACGNAAEVEAFYRFVRNPRVSLEAVVAPHVAATHARCAAIGEVLVLHDTTDMVFAGEAPRPGLTRLGPGRHGFWVHAALAASADGLRVPLGVVALKPFVRPTRPRARARKDDRARFADPEKESRCWGEGIAAVRAQCAATTTPIHVMDRAADSYELFATCLAHHDRFVIRLTHDRRVVGTDGTPDRLATTGTRVAVHCEREVRLTPRRDGKRTLSARTVHPAREARQATLQITAQRVDLVRPKHVPATHPATLAVHIVHVAEVHAPPGMDPVEWRLVTDEPIATAADVLRIVDWYRTRWLIEEFFKALKTGCAFEKRQLESLQTLVVALALFAPIAWRLLVLRHLARERPTTRAGVALTARQLQVLQATSAGAPLSAAPTVAAALQAIARLGGHLRQNGPPGWLVLARGWQKLCTLEAGWAAAERMHLEL
jgi:Transposase DNA-binding/Transposase DDE domain